MSVNISYNLHSQQKIARESSRNFYGNRKSNRYGKQFLTTILYRQSIAYVFHFESTARIGKLLSKGLNK